MNRSTEKFVLDKDYKIAAAQILSHYKFSSSEQFCKELLIPENEEVLASIELLARNDFSESDKQARDKEIATLNFWACVELMYFAVLSLFAGPAVLAIGLLVTGLVYGISRAAGKYSHDNDKLRKLIKPPSKVVQAAKLINENKEKYLPIRVAELEDSVKRLSDSKERGNAQVQEDISPIPEQDLNGSSVFSLEQ